jgi:hypothetical protein
VQLLAAESLLQDRRDPQAALAVLRQIEVPETERRSRFRHGWLMADALETLGQTDAVQLTLQGLQTEFPDSEQVRKRLAQGSKNGQPQSSVRHNAS